MNKFLGCLVLSGITIILLGVTVGGIIAKCLFSALIIITFYELM